MDKLNVYIAAPFADKDKMGEIASKLEGMGCTITHKWWIEEGVVDGEKSEDVEYNRKHAELDLGGVMKANLVLLINSNKSEGKAVEQGIALAKNIPIIAVGKRGEFSKNVFHYHGLYHWAPSLEDGMVIIDFLREIVTKPSPPKWEQRLED